MASPGVGGAPSTSSNHPSSTQRPTVHQLVQGIAVEKPMEIDRKKTRGGCLPRSTENSSLQITSDKLRNRVEQWREKLSWAVEGESPHREIHWNLTKGERSDTMYQDHLEPRRSLWSALRRKRVFYLIFFNQENCDSVLMGGRYFFTLWVYSYAPGKRCLTLIRRIWVLLRFGSDFTHSRASTRNLKFWRSSTKII